MLNNFMIPFKKFIYSSFLIVITLAIAGQNIYAQAPFPGKIIVQEPVFKKDTVSIVEHGAKGDGLTLNTKSISEAIAVLAKKGGGVVLVPGGLWLTGPIVLQSNINLHMSGDAILLFTKDRSQYPLVKSNWEGIDQMRMQPPISADKAVNIAITGTGIVDGNGDGWRQVKKDKLTETQWKKLVASGGVLSNDKKSWFPSEQFKKGTEMGNSPGTITTDKTPEFYASIHDFLRPNMVVLSRCKNILLEGVTFQNSPAWCLHPLMSENIILRDVFVKNPWYAQNGDGIDLESCKNVVIERSTFDVGDDALCMKSGRDKAGRERGMPTENVYINDCTVYASHGGFVIGSEMSGGVRNVYVSNCSFIGSDIGLRFKAARGRGGIVENIAIENIYMKDIPGDAILFDMYYAAKDPIVLEGEQRELPKIELKPKDETTPVFRNFHISNVYCNGADRGIFLRGLPEQHVENIVMENMVLQAKEGIHVQDASHIVFRNIEMLTKPGSVATDIIQSHSLVFDNVKYSHDAATLYRVAGEKCNDIEVSSNAKSKTIIQLGAAANAVKFK